MNVTDRVPGRGEPAVVVNLSVKCLISSSGFTSTLRIFNQSFPGNGTIEVSLSAVESLVSGDSPTTFNDKPSILTRRYNVLGTWNHDVATCNTKDFGLIYETMRSLAQLLVEDENRPNINPLVVRALADATRRYVEALDAVTGGSRGLDLAVANVFKELDAARAPLEPLTFYDSKTGLRILRKVVEVPREVPPQASEKERVEGDQYQDSH